MEARDLFRQKHEEAMAKVVKPTILVCGYTGAGKTSLIQAICGKDTVPDDRIGHGKPMTREFVQYRNDFINLWDSRGLEPGDREAEFLRHTRSLVTRLQADPDAGNHVHLVWYVIQGPGARVTATDLELIRSVFTNVIVVITKNDVTRPKQREAITAELLKQGVSPSAIVAVSEEDPESLRELVAVSLRMLPESYKDAFRSAQLVDLSSKKGRAQAVIHAAAALAAAAGGLNPLPLSDAALITPIQYGMIAGLAVVYGLPAEGVKAGAAPLVAQVAGVMAAGGLSKLIPGLGGVIQAGVASALTEVLGQLVDGWMVRCCAARIKGESLPEFHLPMERLAQLLKAHKK
jgi:uncharacterized protein (DUF697 family)/ethanolamine utilization protein EutP (predicted NTPase)